MTTEAEVLAEFPDNSIGAIDAVNVRNFAEAVWERFNGATAVDATLFNTSPPVPAHTPGYAFWSTSEGMLQIMSEIAGVTLQVGHEQWVDARNNSGSTIMDGDPVRITGASGNRPTIGPDNGMGLAVGLATHDIPNNTNGKVTSYGVVRNLDTSAFADGQTLYSTAAGALTADLTSSRVGTVLLAHNSNGTVLVHPDRRTVSSGTTAQRPTTVMIGFNYFDTTLGLPVFWDGTDWVDGTGSVV